LWFALQRAVVQPGRAGQRSPTGDEAKREERVGRSLTAKEDQQQGHREPWNDEAH
jgi:hypothetical protein